MFKATFVLPFFLIWSVGSTAQDAHTFLQTSLKKYGGLTSYDIEGTRELTTTDEIQRDWHEEGFVLAKASGNRYHFDIKMPDLWDIVISDGTSEWTLQPWKNEYMKRPVPELTPKASASGDVIRARASRYAQNYVEDIAHAKFQAEEFLSDEVITIAGEQIPCRVVRATYQDAEDMLPPDFPAQATFWIEKERGIVRKFSTVARYSFSNLQPLRQPTTTETTSYTKVALGAAPDNLFSFVPPPAAHMVPRLFISDSNVDLSGLPAPPLDLQTFDGTPFDAKSLIGHPVLLEFWASWCVPCVQQMRSVADLAEKYSGRGLVIIGINWSDDRNTALEFLRKNNYHWLNLRDMTGETAKSWMLNGVPLLAIIDPTGKVAYCHSGYQQPEETAILEALKKIDPKFARPSAPCESAAKTP